MEKILEKVVNSSANLILILNFILVIYTFSKREQIYKFSFKWIFFLLVGTLLYSLLEQVLANYILVSKFIFYKSHILPLIKKLKITNKKSGI